MRSDQPKSPSRRTKRAVKHHERRRSAAEVTIVGGLLSLILFVAIVYMSGSMSRSRSAVPAPVASAPHEGALKYRVGAILLLPWSGNACEERGFDNLTGHVVSDQFVDCDLRLAQGGALATATMHTQARMRAITTAFKK